MRGIVYLFISIFSVAITAIAYIGLTFTPIEALLAGLIGLGFAIGVLQRTLHLRDTARLERSIQDLSRLLSTDARAGQNLSQRLNELVDVEPAQRLEVLEADIAVLGTVVRQLAETLSDIEDTQIRTASSKPDDDVDENVLESVTLTETKSTTTKPAQAEILEPVIPVEILRQALGEDRIIHYIEPIITLPQRRTHGYDLVPRLMLEDGDLAQAEDFMPLAGGNDLIAEIEALALVDAITFTRRALTAGEPATLYIPLSSATLGNEREANRVLSLLDANRAICQYIQFLVLENQWTDFKTNERDIIGKIAKMGPGFSLSNVRSLRLDYVELAESGVGSVRADVERFIEQPASYTDYHTADIAAYVNRFEVDLIMTNVRTEQHILTLLDDGIGLAQGPHLALPGPIRTDFMARGSGAHKLKLARS